MVDREAALKELDIETEWMSQHTKSQYFKHVRDYLAYVGAQREWQDRDVLRAYVLTLKKKGLAQPSINYIVRGPIGSLFRAHGLRMPIKLPPTNPAVYELDNNLFWLPEQVTAMIATARASGDPQQAALMAVATIYAPRAAELLKIKAKDVMKDKGILVIHTVKHNLTRTHLIPEAVRDPIYAYKFPTITEAMLRTMFDNLLQRAGVKRKNRQSFHAIRHTLMNELSLAGVTDQQLWDFTGWRKPGTLGSYLPPMSFKPVNDELIFKVHPFLKEWE